MAYNKFTVNITTRVILIALNCFFLITEYLLREYIITVINLAILLVLQVIFLIRYIRRLNLQIIEYFDLIKTRESAFRLRDTQYDNSFSKLRKRFNETNQIIQDVRIEKEVQANYLNHLINYVKIGLFSFDEKGKIQFINPEAKRILGIENVFKLEGLNSLNKDFETILKRIAPGQSEIIELSGSVPNQKLSITCGLLKLKDSNIKLISFQDIDKHLYQNELESWNKLIRILNHEIMNSITPITSLSKTMKKYYSKGDHILNPEDIPLKTIRRTVEGLDIIEERGKGLMNFVNNYRKLSSLPEPDKTNINVYKLFSNTKDFFEEELKKTNIDFRIKVQSKDLTLKADKGQITQILINLIKNSIQAVTDNKKAEIVLSAKKDGDKALIQVSDNGKGIPANIINDIFIPFYTTKDSGSGIGLSISKQLMEMNDGTIAVLSILGKSTEFTLIFNDQHPV